MVLGRIGEGVGKLLVGVDILTSCPGSDTATWLPYLLAREGESLWFDDQAESPEFTDHGACLKI